MSVMLPLPPAGVWGCGLAANVLGEGVIPGTTCNISTENWRAGGILSYRGCSRPAWVKWDPVSKKSGEGVGGKEGAERKGEKSKQATCSEPSCLGRLPHQARPTFSDHTSENILSHPSSKLPPSSTHLQLHDLCLSSSPKHLQRGV